MYNPTKVVYKSVSFKGLGDDIEAKAALGHQRRKERKLRRKERKMEARNSANNVREFLQYFADLIRRKDAGELAADPSVFRTRTPTRTPEDVESVFTNYGAIFAIGLAKEFGHLDSDVENRQAAQALFNSFDSWQHDRNVVQALEQWIKKTTRDGWYPRTTSSTSSSESNQSNQSQLTYSSSSFESNQSNQNDNTPVIFERELVGLNESLCHTIDSLVGQDDLIRIQEYLNEDNISKATNSFICILLGNNIDEDDLVINADTRDDIITKIAETPEVHRAAFKHAIEWLINTAVPEQDRRNVLSSAFSGTRCVSTATEGSGTTDESSHTY